MIRAWTEDDLEEEDCSTRMSIRWQGRRNVDPFGDAPADETVTDETAPAEEDEAPVDESPPDPFAPAPVEPTPGQGG